MTRRHPYRSDRPSDGPSTGAVADNFEERILALVLLVAGALGAAVGLSSPRANATELVLGAFLLVIGLLTLRHARAEQVV